jgi:hypothetical protein
VEKKNAENLSKAISSSMEGTVVAKIYEIGDVRGKQKRLAKLKEMFGELFQHVVIPPAGMAMEELVYILPASLMRRIDDLTLGEMDDLLNNRLKFLILK